MCCVSHFGLTECICEIKGIYSGRSGRSLTTFPKLHMHSAFGRNEQTVTGCTKEGVTIWQSGEVDRFYRLPYFVQGFLGTRDISETPNEPLQSHA